MRTRLPLIYSQNIESIPYHKLKEKGVRYLLFDLDNTIVPAHIHIIEPRIITLFEALKKEFRIMIVSNSNPRRVKKIAHQLKIPYHAFSCKPCPIVFWKLKKKFRCDACEIAMIGDQWFTDMLVGKFFPLFTILVDPISEKDLLLTKINRYFEKRKLKHLQKYGFQKGKYYD